MIVRDLGDAWQVVLQTDHADLSAAFATALAKFQLVSANPPCSRSDEAPVTSSARLRTGSRSA